MIPSREADIWKTAGYDTAAGQFMDPCVKRVPGQSLGFRWNRNTFGVYHLHIRGRACTAGVDIEAEDVSPAVIAAAEIRLVAAINALMGKAE